MEEGSCTEAAVLEQTKSEIEKALPALELSMKAVVVVVEEDNQERCHTSQTFQEDALEVGMHQEEEQPGSQVVDVAYC